MKMYLLVCFCVQGIENQTENDVHDYNRSILSHKWNSSQSQCWLHQRVLGSFFSWLCPHLVGSSIAQVFLCFIFKHNDDEMQNEAECS